MGSTRADIQTWVVNSETLTATHSISGRRKSADGATAGYNELASDVAGQISRRWKTAHLCWLPDGQVRVAISVLIPATKPQTTASRRKRFARQLRERLQPLGWHPVPGSAPHTYEHLPVIPSRTIVKTTL